MPNVPYKYETTDSFILTLIFANGVADLNFDPVTISNKPATLDVFNRYRGADKLVSRVLVFHNSPQLMDAMTFHIYDPKAAYGAAGTSFNNLLKYTVTGFTRLGYGGPGYPAASVAEFIPPTPILVRSVDILNVIGWYSATSGGGSTTCPCTVTTEFQYVNKDGTSPDQVYQGAAA